MGIPSFAETVAVQGIFDVAAAAGVEEQLLVLAVAAATEAVETKAAETTMMKSY